MEKRKIMMICLVCGREFDYIENDGECCPDCGSEKTINK